MWIRPSPEPELGPHGVPAERRVGRRRRCDLLEIGEAGRRPAGGQREAGTDQELAAVEHRWLAILPFDHISPAWRNGRGGAHFC